MAPPTFHVSAEHPAFAGHFPDAPLLPGVVLLDEMLRAMQVSPSAQNNADLEARSKAGALAEWIIASAKFLHPVRPGEMLTFEHEQLTSSNIRFTIRSAGRTVASGTLVPRSLTHEPDHGHQTG